MYTFIFNRQAIIKSCAERKEAEKKSADKAADKPDGRKMFIKINTLRF